MKIFVNLLPEEPGAEERKAREKKVIFISEIVVAIFLFFNLVLFGFYLFITKSSADARAAIKQEKEQISSAQEKEKLYRALFTKLTFLATLWEKKVKPEEIINFSQSLLVPEVSMKKISVEEDGTATVSLSSKNSDGLENFLNKVTEKEKIGQVKTVKVVSTEKNKEGGYDFVLSFKFKANK